VERGGAIRRIGYATGKVGAQGKGRIGKRRGEIEARREVNYWVWEERKEGWGRGWGCGGRGLGGEVPQGEEREGWKGQKEGSEYV